MALTEIKDLLFEYDEQKKIDTLEQAYFNATFFNSQVLRQDPYKTWKHFYSNITGQDLFKDDLEKDIKRYKMRSKRLGLKYPKEFDEK